MQHIEKEFETFKRKVKNENIIKCREISTWISKQVDLDNDSVTNHEIKEKDSKKYHPRRPLRGEIYLAEMGTNVGFEFKDYHPVLIIQNDTGNTFGDTTIVLPITDFGNGEKYDRNIHQQIFNSDFESVVKNGLDKEPSLVKIADITTIDKARLSTKVGKVTPKFMNFIKNKTKNILNLY